MWGVIWSWLIVVFGAVAVRGRGCFGVEEVVAWYLLSLCLCFLLSGRTTRWASGVL